jgi:hypothetical protein
MILIAFLIGCAASFPVCGSRVNVNAGLCFDDHIARVASATAASELTPLAVASDADVVVVAWLNSASATIQARAGAGAVIDLSPPLLMLSSGRRVGASLAPLGAHVGLERHFVLAYDYFTNSTSAHVVVAVFRVDGNSTLAPVQTLDLMPRSSFAVDPDVVALPRGAANSAVAVVAFRGAVLGDATGVDLVRLRYDNVSFVVDRSRPYRSSATVGAVNVFGAAESIWRERYNVPLDSVALFPRLSLFPVEAQRQDVLLAWHECADAAANNCTVFWRTFTSALENPYGGPLPTVSTSISPTRGTVAVPTSLACTPFAGGPGFSIAWHMTVTNLDSALVQTRVGLSHVKPSSEFWGGDEVASGSVGPPSLAGGDSTTFMAWTSAGATKAIKYRDYSPVVSRWDVPADFNVEEFLCDDCTEPKVAAVLRAGGPVSFAIAYATGGAIVVRELMHDGPSRPRGLFGALPEYVAPTTSTKSPSTTTKLPLETTTTVTTTMTMTTTTVTTPVTLTVADSTTTESTTKSTIESTTRSEAITLQTLPDWVVPVLVVLAVAVGVLACALAGIVVLLRRARVTAASEPYMMRSSRVIAAHAGDDDDSEDDDDVDDKPPTDSKSSSSARPVPARSLVKGAAAI